MRSTVQKVSLQLVFPDCSHAPGPLFNLDKFFKDYWTVYVVKSKQALKSTKSINATLSLEQLLTDD
jgi:hypothetical protein